MTLFGREIHPVADSFRYCTDEEFDALVAGMREYGFDPETPCVETRDGVLVDGRNRCRAATEAGVEPLFITTTKEGDELAHWIIRTNVARRHLLSHEAAKLAYENRELYQRLAKGRMSDGGKGMAPGPALVWRDEAAADFGTSGRQVQRYVKIQEKGDAKLIAAVDSGAVSLKKAEQLTKLAPQAQAKAVKKLVDPQLSTKVKDLDTTPAGYDPDEWYTPAHVIDKVREVLGTIDVDPASSEIANATVQATTIYTAEDSGLNKPWKGSVWLNPPYEQPLATYFADKLIEELGNGNITSCIMVQNSGTDTGWYHRLLAVCTAVCLSKGRISFVRESGEEGANRYGQTFFYFGDDLARFEAVFCSVGSILEMRAPYNG